MKDLLIIVALLFVVMVVPMIFIIVKSLITMNRKKPLFNGDAFIQQNNLSRISAPILEKEYASFLCQNNNTNIISRDEDNSVTISIENGVVGDILDTPFKIYEAAVVKKSRHDSQTTAKYKVLCVTLDDEENQLLLASTDFFPVTAEAIKDLIKLNLEGDFPKHFDLYIKKGQENEALRILTPEVMQLVKEDLYGYKVEIVRNKLYIYAEIGLEALSGGEILTFGRMSDDIMAKLLEDSAPFLRKIIPRLKRIDSV